MEILTLCLTLGFMVGVVKSCCFPDTVFTKFETQVSASIDFESSEYDTTDRPPTMVNLAGNVTADFKQQKFLIRMSIRYSGLGWGPQDADSTMFLDLDKGHLISQMGPRCSNLKIYGKIQRSWQCLMDDTSVVKGGPHLRSGRIYTVDFLSVLTGKIVVPYDMCLPAKAHLEMDLLSSEKVTYSIKLSDYTTKINEGILKPPCQGKVEKYPYPVKIPSLKEFKLIVERMLQEERQHGQSSEKGEGGPETTEAISITEPPEEVEVSEESEESGASEETGSSADNDDESSPEYYDWDASADGEEVPL